MENGTAVIWCKTDFDKDDYAEFVQNFSYKNDGKVKLKIACDGIYSVFLNGKLVAFSGCADYPYYKFYDEADVTEYCEEKNDLSVRVWHVGMNFFNYIKADAGVWFEVSCEDRIIARSTEKTPSRIMNEYKNGYCKVITRQLGLSFLYDNTVEKSGFGGSVNTGKSYNPHKRNIKGLVMSERLPVKIIRGEKSTLIDIGKEVAGFIDLEFESPIKQKILFAYGEHIKDGGVRRIIADRDFSFEFIARKGKNDYLNSFRRIAGRYLEIFCDEPLKITYAGIRPVNYPAIKKDVPIKDGLVREIYDVCVDTLKLCMHEHYEDCAWREQALYTLDSRNQMLCGYYAFIGGNAEYARHNLLLISKGLRKDGLLSICFPTGTDVPIPFFSLFYVLQTCEYVKHTKDYGILTETGDTIKTIMNTFREKIDENGLIPSFPYPFWNFYEWADESNNESEIERTADEKYEKSYDLIINCMYVYTARFYTETFGEELPVEHVEKAVLKTFYDGNVFKLSTKTERYSQLGNALAILIGLGDISLADKIVSDKNMITATLSMRGLVFDALLTFGDRYKDFILNDVKERYKKMLDAGATSFWETEKGSEDFGGAGSLCHGWSAIPVYYFNKLSVI